MLGQKVFKDPDLERKVERWAYSCMNGKRIKDEMSSGSKKLSSLDDHIDYYTYSFAETWLENMELRDISFLRQQFPWLRGRVVLREEALEDFLAEQLPSSVPAASLFSEVSQQQH